MSLYKEAEEFIGGGSKGSNGLKVEGWSTRAVQAKIFEKHERKKMKSNPKQVFALVVSTMKYKRFILEIIKKSGIMKVEKGLKEETCMLMVHDLCFTKSGRIQCGKTPLKETILKHKTRLNAELTKLKLKYRVTNVADLVKDSEEDQDQTPVRWFRANMVKTTKEALLNDLKHLQQVDSIEDLQLGSIYHDEYIPNLFGVHPREKITSSDAYLKGRLIIQDRASCFPAHILNPVPKVDKVIDACAAPGNKTTHLASILQNTPNSIIAFEKDHRRSKILKTMCDKAGALKCIAVQQGDFTQTNPQDYPDITGLVVDPSCSGSGIFGRASFGDDLEETKQEIDQNRLTKLASFQFTIVKHALAFPNARKLVYSTCSIHAEENERVVIDLLRDLQVKEQGWRLCRRDQVIPTWERRGFEEEFLDFENGKELAEGLVRSLPKVDGGIGFFAACFERDVNSQGDVIKRQGEEVRREEGEDKEESEDEEESEEWTGFDD